MSVRSFQRLVLPSFRNNYRYVPPLLFSTIPTTNQLNKQIFACETGSKSSNVSNPKNCGSVTSFLKDSGFSDTLLGKIEKTVPKVLSSKLEKTIKPKINLFKNLGLSTTQIATVVSADPRILNRISNHSIESSILVLQKVLDDKLYDPRILKNYGWFLNYDLEKTLLPNVELMKSFGIDQSQILHMFYNSPRFLLHKSERFKDFFRRVDELGFDRKSKLFVYAIRTVGSMSLESWKHKLDVFRGLGYTEVDIISTFSKCPNVFALSERKIKETAEFLLSCGKYDRSFILKYPYIFIYSLERRLKPRVRVLEILERKKILKFEPTTTMFTISESKFFDKFVRPHLNEVRELLFMVSEARS